MDVLAYNRTQLNTERIKKINKRTMVFILPPKASLGTFSRVLRFPYIGVIKDIYASCDSSGGDDTELSVEKCSQSVYDVLPVWESVLAYPVTIKANRRSSKTADIPYELAAGYEQINKDDHFRVVITKSGGASNITVEVVVELDTEID
ncbi:hypothetical protein [Metabacillus fastidiosus]|uniref:hypothetical protein n=1 Tax=Metabacillus fastidiosus TaxID=1458 RepID=UPI003D265991